MQKVTTCLWFDDDGEVVAEIDRDPLRGVRSRFPQRQIMKELSDERMGHKALDFDPLGRTIGNTMLKTENNDNGLFASPLLIHKKSDNKRVKQKRRKANPLSAFVP